MALVVILAIQGIGVMYLAWRCIVAEARANHAVSVVRHNGRVTDSSVDDLRNAYGKQKRRLEVAETRVAIMVNRIERLERMLGAQDVA